MSIDNNADYNNLLSVEGILRKISQSELQTLQFPKLFDVNQPIIYSLKKCRNSQFDNIYLYGEQLFEFIDGKLSLLEGDKYHNYKVRTVEATTCIISQSQLKTMLQQGLDQNLQKQFRMTKNAILLESCEAQRRLDKVFPKTIDFQKSEGQVRNLLPGAVLLPEIRGHKFINYSEVNEGIYIFDGVENKAVFQRIDKARTYQLRAADGELVKLYGSEILDSTKQIRKNKD